MVVMIKSGVTKLLMPYSIKAARGNGEGNPLMERNGAKTARVHLIEF